MAYLPQCITNNALQKVYSLLKDPIIVIVMLICSTACEKIYLPVMELFNKINESSLYQSTIQSLIQFLHLMINNINNNNYCDPFFQFNIKLNKIVFEKLPIQLIDNLPEMLPIQIVFIESGELGKPIKGFMKTCSLKHFQKLLKDNKKPNWEILSSNVDIIQKQVNV